MAGAILAVAVGTAPAAERTLTPQLLVELQRVRQVAPDPSGRQVAYTLEVPRAVDEPPGKSHVELWLVEPGSTPRRFVGGERRVSAPAWSPDGGRISFLAAGGDEEDPRSELHGIPVDGGESHRLFEHEGSIQSYRWSPGARRIAFVATDPTTEEEKADREAGRDWKVFDEAPKYGRLWLYDVAKDEARLWVEQDLDVSDVAWSPDGASVVFVAAATPRVDAEYMFSKIYRLELEGTPQVLTETSGKIGPLAFSPDGRQLAFLAASSLSDPLAQSLFVVPASGGVARNLTQDYEGSGADLAWSEEHGLVLLAVEGTRQALHRVDPRTGKREAIDWPRWIVQDLAVAGGRIAVAAESPEHPSEVFLLGPGASRPARLTRHSAVLEGVRLARQEVIEWRGADDWPIAGVLTYPLDYREGRRYPLVLQLHGGPEGVSLDGWTSSVLTPVQPLAARGFVVLEPNYRGSAGRGVAFSKADHDDLGGKEFEDVLAGVDHLIERGLVDGDRVGTGGWSYGGYLSAWAATRHSQRFRAAVVAAGLTNWIAFAGTTDIPYEMSLVHWNSWWFDEPELHWRRSPLAHLQHARTATLIVHGERDDRVHPEQSLELYTALRIKGVPTRLVFYPREPHGLDERAHRLDFVERSIAWFETHLAE